MIRRSSTGRMIMTTMMMVLIRRMSVTMRMRMAKVRKEGGATRMEPETVSSGFAPLKSNDNQDLLNTTALHHSEKVMLSFR